MGQGMESGVDADVVCCNGLRIESATMFGVHLLNCMAPLSTADIQTPMADAEHHKESMWNRSQ